MKFAIRRCSIAALVLFAFVTGCASGPGGGQVAFSSDSAAGKAGVQVDASALTADKLDAFLQQDGAQQIGIKVAEKLAAAGKGDGGLVVKVRITGFRLRSVSSALWLGAMAGADTVACTVEVSRGGETQPPFSTDTSSVMGGLIMPGTTTRFNRLANELANRIVAGV
jgi:hypothetical protein